MAEKETKSEDLITIIVDPEMTDGGIRINEKRYVGKVTVSQEIANELMRIQEEYFETKKKLSNPNQPVRIKNSKVIAQLFMADPQQYGNNPKFSKELGMLDAWNWQFVSESFKKELKETRMGQYGY